MTDSAPVPEPSPVSAPFWDATRRRELSMQRCESCNHLVWYPRCICPHCGATALHWETLSGNGVVYAVSVHHRPAFPALADKVPYSVVLVDLDEGARMMSNVFGPVPAVGDRVKVAWVTLDDGRNLAVFQPHSESQ
ncbi:Zn-ribbon domain-containing OB-fold protein [Mycobacterium vicinigordonae]|uniref:OB-fold domain-containing protein n=1 Tax=Mycobacterium vicinigordonae TaxID=1719132 RepID=A0A7D6E1L4_9MYCO|nr:OB-fold domain-containing protein [Mycobacterium vicinigordonae]QLL08929.1 OB-fold domain-containing protein [Mycobacterium vicinigordonae]